MGGGAARCASPVWMMPEQVWLCLANHKHCHDSIEARLRKTLQQGWLARPGRSTVAARLDQAARGRGFVAQRCGSEHGIAKVVRPRSSQMEGVSDPLPEGA